MCNSGKQAIGGHADSQKKTERKTFRYNGQCQVVAVKASGLFDLDCTLSASASEVHGES